MALRVPSLNWRRVQNVGHFFFSTNQLTTQRSEPILWKRFKIDAISAVMVSINWSTFKQGPNPFLTS